MKYLSVCSGIEAATVAWHPLGWDPVGFAEIEPFPAAVLAHHYPEVPNFGDMTKYKEWNLERGAIDLLVGGTPCQSFSVAGLRKGLADPRGNLALVYCGILDHLRPEWFVWENVPGVLSSNGGRDFGSFLGALAELGYGFAYRVLDAQYFGVAQRRRRVFVVGYLGDWRPAAEVLFERESVLGHPAPRRETRQRIAGSTAFGVGERSELAHCLRSGASRADKHESTTYVAARMVAFGEYVDDGTASAMKARDYKDATDLVAQPAYGIPGNWIGRQPDNGGNAVEPMHDVAPCLTKADRHGVAQPLGFNARQDPDSWQDRTGPLDTFSTQAVAFTCSEQSNSFAWERPYAPTITAQQPSDTSNLQTGVRLGMTVRRLTPVECERLQGFPDRYTEIPWRKKEAAECPDGPRYKALGNSMAVPVMAWIGQRIAMYKQQQNRMVA